jgi:hypothetical protein
MTFNLKEGDTTHLNQKGAEVITDLIMSEIKVVATDLNAHMQQPVNAELSW